MQRSQRFRELMQDLFAGTQSYLGLRTRLLRSLNGGVHEAVMHFFLDRVIPEFVIPSLAVTMSGISRGARTLRPRRHS